MNSLLDRYTNEHAELSLGPVATRTDIKSSFGQFRTLPGYRIAYPDVVVQALGELYQEYNLAFNPLMEANREWGSDYRHCMMNGNPVNFVVQIDMVGLSQAFLDAIAPLPVQEVREILRGRIFEFENSVAMYQLLERLFQNGHGDSFFKRRFRACLNDVRERFGKPVALLAVTDAKYRAICESEFGNRDGGASLEDAEVSALSGFDRCFNPQAFREHVEANGGGCDYLLYVRSSDPVVKLKDPTAEVEHPLLGDADMRMVIKAHALTFSIDDPSLPVAHHRRINDTKGYMPSMGMAFPVQSETDILTPDYLHHLTNRKRPDDTFLGGERLNPAFKMFLLSRRMDPEEVASGKTPLRAKPLKGTYGCYGHFSGVVTSGDFRRDLRSNLRKRGGYVVQPEMSTPRITNATDGSTFTFIDRNFFGVAGGSPRFLGGVRSMMPVDSDEAKSLRNHGNASTVSAEIVVN